MVVKKLGMSIDLMINNFYGQINRNHTLSEIKKVCDILGYGKNKVADSLIKETLMAETHFGLLKDPSFFAGMGIAQFDEVPFCDVLRGQNIAKWKDIILDELDIDISIIKWEDLRYNTFLSVIFCRLKYKLIPEPIPYSLEKRAHYWKEYYNSKKGKGTIKHYIEVNI